MDLPRLEEPQRYRGLYVYDFGEWAAVGYTGEEIAVLLESEQYRHGKVYKIQRASPDGRLELSGVSVQRFRLESGVFFYRADRRQARADFEQFCAAARSRPVPCRAFVHLADRAPAAAATRFVTAFVYPAEFEDEISEWLLATGFQGGELVEGGSSHVSNYYAEEKEIIERCQLWSRSTTPSRCAEEVLANVRCAVQR